ncbi:MAG: class I SAM-dependent methyltransferase [Mariprofundaceae bacterium]
MALREAIGKHCWQKTQGKELEYWHGHTILQRAHQYAEAWLLPTIEHELQNMPDNMAILEIGCGPVCTIQHITKGNKHYLDPLLDDYRRQYPGMLPKGEYIVDMAEHIDKKKQSFHAIMVFNALDRVMNPELVLSEMKRLLAPYGRIFISVAVYPTLIVRLNMLYAKICGYMGIENHPYLYAGSGIEKSISRHFKILSTNKVPPVRRSHRFFGQYSHLFICTHHQ